MIELRAADSRRPPPPFRGTNTLTEREVFFDFGNPIFVIFFNPSILRRSMSLVSPLTSEPIACKSAWFTAQGATALDVVTTPKCHLIDGTVRRVRISNAIFGTTN